MKNTMKKLNVLLITITLCLVASYASAFPFESENGDVALYYYGYPGKLQNQNATEKYDAFCIQRSATIWNSHDSKGKLVRPYDVKAVNNVTLNDNAKWLYAAYHEGIFNDISEESLDALDLQTETTQKFGVSTLGIAVQYGIWHTQQGDLGEKAKDAWDLFDDYLAKTNWSTFENRWDIRSIELSLDQNNGKTLSMQTQIVGVSTTSEVPEPGTMALFGFGLLGLAGVVKRRRMQSGTPDEDSRQ